MKLQTTAPLVRIHRTDQNRRAQRGSSRTLTTTNDHVLIECVVGPRYVLTTRHRKDVNAALPLFSRIGTRTVTMPHCVVRLGVSV